MPRKKLLSDSQVIEAKRKIDNNETSLRAISKELGIHHSSLDSRIKKLKTQSKLISEDEYLKLVTKGISKPDTKPDIIKPKPDIIDNILFPINNKKEIIKLKPDTKPDTEKLYLSTSLLRGLREMVLKQNDDRKTKRNDLLDIFINEFQKQKDLIR